MRSAPIPDTGLSVGPVNHRGMDRKTSPEIDQFFHEYAAALNGADADGVADRFSYPALLVSDEGALVVHDHQAAMDGIRAADARYRAMGFTRAVVEVRSVEQLSQRINLVGIHWDYLGDADRAIYDNAYRYLVRRDDDGAHRISVAISIDEAGELVGSRSVGPESGAGEVPLPLPPGRSGGMADAADLNSAAREGVRVRIPAPAPASAACSA